MEEEKLINKEQDSIEEESKGKKPAQPRVMDIFLISTTEEEQNSPTKDFTGAVEAVMNIPLGEARRLMIPQF